MLYRVSAKQNIDLLFNCVADITFSASIFVKSQEPSFSILSSKASFRAYVQ